MIERFGASDGRADACVPPPACAGFPARAERAGFILFCLGSSVDVLAKGTIFGMHAEQHFW